MLRRLLLAVLCALCAAPTAAHANVLLPPAGKVLTGVAMGYELDDFTRRVGHRPYVWEHCVTVDRSYQWALKLAAAQDTRILLHLSTAPGGQDSPGTIAPRAIARGASDRWLLGLRAALVDFGRPAYVRPFGEMNNCHNAYAPLNCNGSSRGASHSARSLIAAHRRITLIMHGGRRASINQRLGRLRLPKLRGGFVPEELPKAPIATVWSPMTGGSPMIAALDPARFFPGRRWTDWVGTSFYSRFPNFRYLTPFYQRFSARQRLPFMFAEWAMWSNGDPGFVRRLLAWTHAHPRTKMLVYNQGKRADGPFRLQRFLGAARALRDGLNHRAFR